MVSGPLALRLFQIRNPSPVETFHKGINNSNGFIGTHRIPQSTLATASFAHDIPQRSSSKFLTNSLPKGNSRGEEFRTLCVTHRCDLPVSIPLAGRRNHRIEQGPSPLPYPLLLLELSAVEHAVYGRYRLGNCPGSSHGADSLSLSQQQRRSAAVPHEREISGQVP